MDTGVRRRGEGRDPPLKFSIPENFQSTILQFHWGKKIIKRIGKLCRVQHHPEVFLINSVIWLYIFSCLVVFFTFSSFHVLPFALWPPNPSSEMKSYVRHCSWIFVGRTHLGACAIELPEFRCTAIPCPSNQGMPPDCGCALYKAR